MTRAECQFPMAIPPPTAESGVLDNAFFAFTPEDLGMEAIWRVKGWAVGAPGGLFLADPGGQLFKFEPGVDIIAGETSATTFTTATNATVNTITRGGWQVDAFENPSDDIMLNWRRTARDYERIHPITIGSPYSDSGWRLQISWGPLGGGHKDDYLSPGVPGGASLKSDFIFSTVTDAGSFSLYSRPVPGDYSSNVRLKFRRPLPTSTGIIYVEVGAGIVLRQATNPYPTPPTLGPRWSVGAEDGICIDMAAWFPYYVPDDSDGGQRATWEQFGGGLLLGPTRKPFKAWCVTHP